MYNANKSLDRALDTVSGSKSSKETLRGISSVSMNSLNFLFISSPEQLGQKKQRNTRQKGDTKIRPNFERTEGQLQILRNAPKITVATIH